MTTTIISEGIPNLQRFLGAMPGITKRSARLAINQVADRQGLKAARKAIYDEVAFPKGYITPDKLFISQRATDDNLEAIVTGRQKATSLARFASGQSPGRGATVKLNIQPGKTSIVTRAFLVRLKKGSAAISEGSYNIGLAVRLKPGESLSRKYKMAPYGKHGKNTGLYLLYGPSVDQAFRSVAEKLSPSIAEDMTLEFLRQFDRLSERL